MADILQVPPANRDYIAAQLEAGLVGPVGNAFLVAKVVEVLCAIGEAFAGTKRWKQAHRRFEGFDKEFPAHHQLQSIWED